MSLPSSSPTLWRCADVARLRLAGPGTLVALAVVVAIVAAPATPLLEATPSADGPARSRSAQSGLHSLPPAAQATISNVLGRDDRAYHVSATSRGFRGENPAHGLGVDFTRSGIVVRAGAARLRLRLESVGYGAELRPVAAARPSATANRVEYRRGSITEWYANGPLGLEQGFTLNAPPARPRAGPLTLALRLSGALRASLEPGSRSLRLAVQGRPASLRYRGLSAWDARGRALRAWLAVEDANLVVRVADAGARYPLTVDPFLETATLTASPDGAASDRFGISVAVSGDTIVVGQLFTDAGVSAEGSAYVFVKPAGGWGNATDPAKLTASDGAPDEAFGGSVAVSGDVVVVGARPYQSGVNVPGEGSAYVFVEPGGGWANGTETAKLTASDGAPEDVFGMSVAVSGGTVVVGAPGDTVGADADQGSAYVFVEPGGGWASGTETAKLTASDGATDDQLGFAVAVSGDTVVAGAPSDDVGANTGQGSAYVFVEPGGGWASGTETAKLTASDGAAGDDFGRSVAVSGDTLVAGAPSDDVGANTGQGSAYVFVEPGGGWANGTETAKLTASDGDTEDSFGDRVAVSGDTVLAGAPFDNVGGAAHRGSAYVFVEPGGGWANATETAKLTASDGAFNNEFGGSVAVSGDTVVIGAPQDDGVVNQYEGSAYLFVQPGGGWTSGAETTKLLSDETATDQFGYSVAVSSGTVVVGAPRDDVGGTVDQGSAYVFVGVGGPSGAQAVKLTAAGGAANDRFGYSVAVSGDTVVVGAPLDDQGAAYVFVEPGGGWVSGTQTAELTASDRAVGDQLGFAVAVSGDTVVAGAIGDNVGANADQGSAYVFVEPGGGWASATETAKLTASDGASVDRSGFSVSVSGDSVAVGTPFDDVGANADQGSAYLFVEPGGGWASGTETAKLTASDGAVDDEFAQSVAVSGDTVVAGAVFDNVGANADQGSAYVFVEPGGGWVSATETAKLTASDGATIDRFGRSVAAEAKAVVVGAVGDTVGGNASQGSAYVFVEPDGGWTSSTETEKLTASGGATDDQLGHAVAVSGAWIVVGAPLDDVGANADQGSASVFESPGPPGSPAYLRVTTSPAVPSQVSVDGVPMDSWGLSWVKFPVGQHTVSFSDVEGFSTPADQVVLVDHGATTTVTGTFVPRGLLRVLTSPAVAGTIFVDGLPRNDWGMWTWLPTGSHQVCFGPVAELAAPSCQTANLEAGSQTTVTGIYSSSPGAPGQAGVGFLRVVTSPAVRSQVSVDGVPMDSWGLSWVKVPVGQHTVSFSDVEGFSTPADQVVLVGEGTTTTVTGTFVPRGLLRVLTSPAVAGTIFVDGLPRNDWGMWTWLPTGSHQVCFGPVAGMSTPPCQDVTLDPGALTSVTGTYG